MSSAIVKHTNNFYSGFDPRSVQGCILWLDAADSSSYTMSGSNLSSWKDKSVSAYTCSPVTSNNITQSTQNGLNVFYFNNVRASISSFVWNHECTLFVVTKSAASTFIYALMNGTTYLDYFYIANNALFYLNSAYQLYDSNASGTPIQTANTWGVASIGYTAGTGVTNFAVNGTTRTTRNITGTAPSAGTSTTGTLYLNGNGTAATDASYIAEIIQYNRPVTTIERQRIEGYLAWKWGLKSSFVVSHPYYYYTPPTRLFQPTDIDGCRFWIDAADYSTLTLSTNTVTGVKDKSGYGSNLTSGTGFTWNVTKFNTSYPSFYNASTTGAVVGVNSSFSLAQPMTIFFAGATGALTGFHDLCDSTTSGNRVTIYYWNAAPLVLRLYSGNAATPLSGTSTVGTNSTFVNSIIVNGTSSILYENGAVTAQSGNPGSQGFTGLTIGNRYNYTGSPEGFFGHICEVIIFNSSLSTAQRQQVEGYLAWKWGIKSRLSSGHPFLSYPPLTPLFTPTQIPNCRLWLDAADSSTITLSGSNVTQWNDKSGNSFNAVQTVTGKYPSYASTAVNGLSAIQTSSTGTTMYVPSLTVTFPPTVIMVVKKTGTGGFNTGFVEMGPNVNTSNGFYITPINNSFFSARAGGGQQQFYDSVGTGTARFNAVGTTYIYVCQVTPNTLYVNGTSITVSTVINSGNPTGSLTAQLNIGSRDQSSLFADVQYCEILIYSGNLTLTQIQRVEGYLAWKWGVNTSILPTTHPYYKFRP